MIGETLLDRKRSNGEQMSHFSREKNADFCNTEEHASKLYNVPSSFIFLSQTVCSTTTDRKCPQLYQLILLLVIVMFPNWKISENICVQFPWADELVEWTQRSLLHRPVTRFNFGHWVDKNSKLLESQGCTFLLRSQVTVAIRIEATKMHSSHQRIPSPPCNISSNLLKVVRQQKRTFFVHSNSLHRSNFPHSFHYFIKQPHALKFRAGVFVDIEKNSDFTDENCLVSIKLSESALRNRKSP